MSETTNTKRVIVTTKHRGVFVGYLADDQQPARVTLTECRMAIRWGTTRGLLELAQDGPNSATKMSGEAPEVVLHDITSVIGITDEADAAFGRVS
jgi:hypothetical protein